MGKSMICRNCKLPIQELGGAFGYEHSIGFILCRNATKRYTGRVVTFLAEADDKYGDMHRAAPMSALELLAHQAE